MRQRYRPLRRVGICVPGGAAAYPSTLLMTAVPAQTAGVKEIAVVAPPTPFGSYNGHLLAACHELGITEVYRIGGAQAVAAMAYGVEGIERVDKIARGSRNRFSGSHCCVRALRMLGAVLQEADAIRRAADATVTIHRTGAAAKERLHSSPFGQSARPAGAGDRRTIRGIGRGARRGGRTARCTSTCSGTRRCTGTATPGTPRAGGPAWCRHRPWLRDPYEDP